MNVNKNSRVEQELAEQISPNTFFISCLYRGDTIVFATAITTVSPQHPLFLVAGLAIASNGIDIEIRKPTFVCDAFHWKLFFGLLVLLLAFHATDKDALFKIVHFLVISSQLIQSVHHWYSRRIIVKIG